MTDYPTIPGDFDVVSSTTSPLSAASSGNAKNPIALAHIALLRDLAPIAVPHLHVNPEPEEFEDVADYIVRVANIVDRWLHAVGAEIKSNSTVAVDMNVFTGTMAAAVQGNATFECDRSAESLREDNADLRQAVRYGRTLGHIVDVYRKERGV